MLKGALGFCWGVIKATIFAIIVLILGNTVKVGDLTISDQIKTRMAHAERSPTIRQAKAVAEDLGTGARHGAATVSREISRKLSEMDRPAKRSEIPSAERQKLRNLIDAQ